MLPTQKLFLAISGTYVCSMKEPWYIYLPVESDQTNLCELHFTLTSRVKTQIENVRIN